MNIFLMSLYAFGFLCGFSFQFVFKQCNTVKKPLCVSQQPDLSFGNFENRCGPGDNNINLFYNHVINQEKISDKVTTHQYHQMYGIFLSAYKNKKVKMLEIGLGCNMNYGPGASVSVWKTYFDISSEIWMAEFDSECVKQNENSKMMQNVHVLVGDQSNKEVLNKWLTISGANFDFIIDDGGHTNVMIKNSFDVLWDSLKPGGLYFIEDLHVSRDNDSWQNKIENGKTMADMIELWIDALLVGGDKPKQLDFIFCQREACVFGKSV